MTTMIKILIVDDSPTDAAILKSIFESEPGLSVIADALAMVKKA